jgi:hypothetical protein
MRRQSRGWLLWTALVINRQTIVYRRSTQALAR